MNHQRTIGAATIAVATIAIMAAGCRPQPAICQPQNAHDLGYSHGSAGLAKDGTKLGRCTGTSVESYRAGYRKGLAQFCDPAVLEAVGEEVGLEGRRAPLDPDGYKICEGISDPFAAFEAGNARGFAVFCEGGLHLAAATELGESGEAYASDLERYSDCGEAKIEAIATQSKQAYEKGIALFCTGQRAYAAADEAGSSGNELPGFSENYLRCGEKTARRIERKTEKIHMSLLRRFCAASTTDLGYADGESGSQPRDIRERNRLCRATDIERAVAAYDAGFVRGIRSFCSNDRYAALAAAKAEDGDSTVPVEIGVCIEYVGGAELAYARQFGRARRAFVAANCTRERGYDVGQTDAASLGVRDTTMPSFCDGGRFATYTRGYREGWRLAKLELCSPQTAEDEGREAGLRGDPPDHYEAPELCRGSYGAAHANAWNDGWAAGAAEYEAEAQRRSEAERIAEQERREADRIAAAEAREAADKGDREDGDEVDDEDDVAESSYASSSYSTNVSYDEFVYADLDRGFGRALIGTEDLRFPDRVGISIQIYMFDSGIFVAYLRQYRRLSDTNIQTTGENFIQGKWEQVRANLVLEGLGEATYLTYNAEPSIDVSLDYSSLVRGRSIILSKGATSVNARLLRKAMRAESVRPLF